MNKVEQSTNQEQREHQLFYKRPSEVIDAQLQQLTSLEQSECLELTKKEKERVLEEETKLAEQLSEILEINSPRAVFYNVASGDLGLGKENFEDIKTAAQESAKKMPQEFLAAISQTFNADTGTFDFSAYPEPTKELYIHEREKVAARSAALRAFKDGLKSRYDAITTNSDASNEEKSFAKLLTMYARKANCMIALTERPLNGDRGAVRYDRFVYGAGEKSALTPELIAFADDMEKQSLAAKLEEKEKTQAQQNLENKMIAEKDVQTIVESAMGEYEFLEEDGWEVLFEEGRTEPNIDPQKKILTFPAGPATLRKVTESYLGFFVEGYVLQAENRKRFDTRLVQDIRADRSLIFENINSMSAKKAVAEELFGEKIFPKTGYVRAMQKREAGGSYRECVAAYYEPQRKELAALYQAGKIESPEDFERACRKAADVAIQSTRRLFEGTENLGGTKDGATNSKDLIYLEQAMVHEALKKHDMSHVTAIGGVNVQALIELSQAGLGGLGEMKKSRGIAKRVFEQHQ